MILGVERPSIVLEQLDLIFIIIIIIIFFFFRQLSKRKAFDTTRHVAMVFRYKYHTV